MEGIKEEWSLCPFSLALRRDKRSPGHFSSLFPLTPQWQQGPNPTLAVPKRVGRLFFCSAHPHNSGPGISTVPVPNGVLSVYMCWTSASCIPCRKLCPLRSSPAALLQISNSCTHTPWAPQAFLSNLPNKKTQDATKHWQCIYFCCRAHAPELEIQMWATLVFWQPNSNPGNFKSIHSSFLPICISLNSFDPQHLPSSHRMVLKPCLN